MLQIRDGRRYALALGMCVCALLVSAAPARAQTAPDAGVRVGDAGAPVAVLPVAASPPDAAPQEQPPQAEPPIEAPTPEETAAAPSVEGEGLTSSTGFACAEIMDDNGNVQRLRRNGIVGLVKDGATGETIIEGVVQVVGGRRVFTNYDGCFQIELPPGTYTLRITYDLYQTARLTNVVVRRGEASEVTIDLQPDTETLAEVVVTARADRATESTQLELRRQSASVSDSISAQEIARSPDSNAGDAVRRVVGASVVGGQYLFVRGLGGRYTNVLLNGVQMPGSDPDNPSVQLDLFPASVLASLSILKTYTADMPASGAGGVMQITTREFPSKFTFGLNLSLGANTITTFQDGPSYRGGSLDWLGYDDGTRALPESAEAQRLNSDRDTLTADQVNEAARDFRNIWNLPNQLALPNMRFGATVGDSIDLGGRRLGYLVNFGYQRNTQILNERVGRARLASSGVEQAQLLDRRSMNRSTLLGALATLTLEVDDGDEIGLTFLWNQASDNYAGLLTGDFDEFMVPAIAWRMQWTERSLYFAQLHGDHQNLPGKARFKWQLYLAEAQRADPDTRDVTYQRNPEGTYSAVPSSFSSVRFFSELAQTDVGGNMDLSIPAGSATVKLGGLLRASGRDFSFRRFRYRNASGPAAQLPPEQLFGSVGSDATELDFDEFTDPSDGYAATQTTAAAYAMIDWPIVESIRFIAGVRGEGFRQTIETDPTFARFPNRAPDTVDRTDLDPLPSGSLVFRLIEQMFLRASYSRTVARPSTREIAPFSYPDFVRQRTVLGESTLRRTTIDNFDLRWEFFPGSTEVLAVTGFVKLFRNPIESTIIGVDGGYTFLNAEGATNYGGEFEARISLGRITKALAAFSVGANLALINSSIRLNTVQLANSTSSERPMAGQSPYVANVSLGFNPADSGFAVRLFYNVFGRRITDVGQQMVPDIYQQPFHSLDLTAVWEASELLTLKASAENLLSDDYDLTQGPTVTLRYRPGVTLNVGATLNF